MIEKDVAGRSEAPFGRRFGKLPLTALLLSLAFISTPTLSVEPENMLTWTDPQRFAAFSDALRAKMERVGIDPVLINHAIRFQTERPPLKPLVVDRRSDLQILQARPSIGQQLLWRSQLDVIAKELRLEFADSINSSVRSPNPESIAMTGDLKSEILNQNTDLIIRLTLSTLPDLATDFSSKASTKAIVFKLSGNAGTPPRGTGVAPRWMTKVRIAETSRPSLNEEIRLSLERIKRRFPNAPIDEHSFPAQVNDANFLFVSAQSLVPADRQGDARPMDSFVFSLTKSDNLRLRDLAKLSNNKSRVDAIRSTKGLDLLYLSQPYWMHAPIPAVIEVDTMGVITSSLCIYDDSDAVDITPSQTRMNFLDMCILGGLGGYYGGEDEIDPPPMLQAQ